MDTTTDFRQRAAERLLAFGREDTALRAAMPALAARAASDPTAARELDAIGERLAEIARATRPYVQVARMSDDQREAVMRLLHGNRIRELASSTSLGRRLLAGGR